MKPTITHQLGRGALLMALCLGLAGCASLSGFASLSKEDITPAGLTVVNRHPETVLINITRNNKFDPRNTSYDVSHAMQDAIVDSIIQSGLFSLAVTTSNADYQLDVRLLDGTMEFDYQQRPVTFSCTTHAIWELTRTQDHKLVYKDDVTTGGNATEVSHGFYGSISSFDAVAASIRKNIQAAIERMGIIKAFDELQIQSIDESLQGSLATKANGVQTPGSTLGPSFKPGESIPVGKAAVYIYRPGGAKGGAGIAFGVKVNGKGDITLVQGGYYVYFAEPGNIVLTAFEIGFMAPKSTSSLTVDAKADQAYYIKGSHGRGALGRARLESVSPEAGAKEMANCKLIP